VSTIICGSQPERPAIGADDRPGMPLVERQHVRDSMTLGQDDVRRVGQIETQLGVLREDRVGSGDVTQTGDGRPLSR
jgi:hypothetical protein